MCPGSGQKLQDLVLYASHSDHQLKGQAALIVGSFVKAALLEGRFDFNKWLIKHLPCDQGEHTPAFLQHFLVNTIWYNDFIVSFKMIYY